MALTHLLGEPARGTRAGARLAKAVFIDKDGTLVEDVPYNVDPALVRFTPHAIEGLRLLADAGYRIVVVTNQPGVALGRFDLDALRHLQAALTRMLAQAGVPLTGFQACPHAPAAPGAVAACQCRKPAPGMLLQAAARLELNLGASWMVGDILDDVEAGHRAGCRSVLLDVGNETLWERTLLRTPDAVATDLLGAAQQIIARDTGAARSRAVPPTPVHARLAPQKGAVRWIG